MSKAFRLNERASGLLLHPTSLPGPHGCGDLGSEAYRFVDFLAAAGQRWWQMLPIGPPGPGNAPYSSFSALAGSPLLVSLERLADEGLLSSSDLTPTHDLRLERASYGAAARFRTARLQRAFSRFEQRGGTRGAAFRRFCDDQRHWLDDYALYAALKRAHRDQAWRKWPRELRFRRKPALARARAQLRREIEFQQFVQFQFDRQWAALRRYAHERGVGLLGDIPIFVAHDGADVWARPDLFDLDRTGRPKAVSGVPPDLFSRTGQLWGHPHYRWPRHRATHFAWWIKRFRRTFDQFDAVRVDHFLGFDRVWAVPGRAKTAQRGCWVKTPGRELFQAVRRALSRVEIVAEDLGVVTPEALALRDRFGFPGMRLLHFAFESDGEHYHEPDAHLRNCVVYPGTHDNDTTVGWFRALRAAAKKRRRRGKLSKYERVLRYLGTGGREIHWDMIRLALMSVANLTIIPVQDLLGLGNEARMNYPGTSKGNWEWRLPAGTLTNALAKRLRDLTITFDRVRRGGGSP